MALTVCFLSPFSVTPYRLLESRFHMPFAVCIPPFFAFPLTVTISEFILNTELLKVGKFGPDVSSKQQILRDNPCSLVRPNPLLDKNIILKNFKLLQNDKETSRIFSLPLLISFKRNKNISDFLVRSTLKSDESPGTFKCTRNRCKTCPFIQNTGRVTGPKRSIKITDRFTCTSANVIYCIKCTLCKKIYIGETGRRLGDRFREHLRDVERNDKDASKPVARHFNLPNHSIQNMAICGLSMHQGNTESRKNLEQKYIFRLGSLSSPRHQRTFLVRLIIHFIDLLPFKHRHGSTESIAFSWTRRRNFSTSCLTANSSVRLAMGTKFKPLLRTDFSGSESGKSAGMVTTVLLFSSDWLLVILGPSKF